MPYAFARREIAASRAPKGEEGQGWDGGDGADTARDAAREQVMKRSDFNFSNLDTQNPGAGPRGVKLVFASCCSWSSPWLAGGSRSETSRANWRTSSRRGGLKKEFATKQAKAVNLPALKQQLEEMKDMLRQMLRQLPSKTNAELLVDISQTALSSGIENELFQPGTEAVKEFYAERPISLRMVGTYHQFGSFHQWRGFACPAWLSSPCTMCPAPEYLRIRGVAAPTGTLTLEGTVKTISLCGGR